jgi:hypothetical protein
MRKSILALSAALVLLLVLAVPASAVVDPDAQTWYLDSVTHSTGNGLVMEKEGSGAQSGSVDIGIGEDHALLWISNGSPQDGDVAFSGGDYWVINLKTSDWHSSCTALLGTVDSNGENFDDFENLIPLKYRYSNAGILEIQLQTDPEDAIVPQYSYLALKVINTSTSTQTIDTLGVGSSYISAPDSDPVYPTPEIAAGVLFGLGLAGVGAFIMVRRKQGKASSAR